MKEPARIMMYAQDSYGLGHLRRTTNLANDLVMRRQDLSILLVVDSPVAPFFELRGRIDFVKLPTLVKVAAGVFKPGQLLANYDVVHTMRSTIIREVTRWFQPHVLLVDHMPGGANRELMPVLEMLRRDRLRTTMVLGLRDIIDDPEVTCPLWQREGVYETLEQYYDWVLIYGSPHVFPTAEKYRVPGPVSEKVLYCGYVCSLAPVKSPERVRAKLGLGGEPLVMVMAGGGADAYRLMKTHLDAVDLLRGQMSFATLMVTGPFMPEAQRAALRKQAKSLGVKFHRSVGDTLSHLNAADLVVSMAGYNTVSEILRFNKRAVIVPRAGPSAEQTMRAELVAQQGLARMLHPRDLSAARLADALLAELSAGCTAVRNGGPPLGGLSKACRVILSLVEDGSVRPGRLEARQALSTAPQSSVAADNLSLRANVSPTALDVPSNRTPHR